MASLPSPADATAGTRLGLSLLVAAMVIVPVIDAMAKLLSATMPPLQIAWLRFAVGVAIMAPVALVWGEGRRVTAREGVLHVVRGAGIAGATAFFFAAVAVMPLAEVAAIFFTEPLILTILSAVLLGEGIGWRRVAAIVVGFAGAMVIVDPAFDAFGWSALLPLGAAACFAIYMVATKVLAGSCDPWTMQALANLAGFATLGALMLTLGEAVEPVWPRADQLGQIAVMGGIAALCHTLIIYALRRISAGAAAPFQYLEIIGAVFWGYLIFADWPEARTWLGIAIVTGAGLYVFWREGRTAGHT